MRRSRTSVLPFLVAALVALLAGCASPRALDQEPMDLNAAEAASVRSQVERARAEAARSGDWTAAWNQAVDAGLGRDVLEGIALDALADRGGGADDMLAALRTKWGALSSQGRSRVRALSDASAGEGRYVRAAEIEIQAADDAPAFVEAWRIYGDTRVPPGQSVEILELIREARETHGETSE